MYSAFPMYLFFFPSYVEKVLPFNNKSTMVLFGFTLALFPHTALLLSLFIFPFFFYIFVFNTLPFSFHQNFFHVIAEVTQ